MKSKIDGKRSFVLVAMLLGACEPQGSGNVDRAIASIQTRDSTWLKAAASRDLDGMMSIYAPDAREMLQGLPPLVGRDSIRLFYKHLLNRQPRFSHHFEPDAITVASSGDLAVARGSYRFTPDTLTPRVVNKGKYVGVWRLRDGTWKLLINISNSNGPPANHSGASDASP